MPIDLSVVIPIYNASTTINESIRSVVSELVDSGLQWELFLINDGSTDNSLEIITCYREKSPYKKCLQIFSQENQGVSAARNLGLIHAQGEFIAFNDADDRWLPGKIKCQIDYLNGHPEVDMIGGLFGDDNMTNIKRIKHEAIITIKDQLFKNYFATQCIMSRRILLKKTGLFDPRMRHFEDIYLVNKMVYYGTSVLTLDKMAECITNKKRWGESGLTASLHKQEAGELYNIYYAWQSHYVSFSLFLIAVPFSLLKFIRRLLVREMSNILK